MVVQTAAKGCDAAAYEFGGTHTLSQAGRERGSERANEGTSEQASE